MIQRIINEALVTDYMSSDQLDSIMNTTREFGDFSDYSQHNNMIVQTRRVSPVFSGAPKMIDSKYWKFDKVNDNEWEIHQVASDGSDLGKDHFTVIPLQEKYNSNKDKFNMTIKRLSESTEDPKDYKVFTLCMDVAVPADKDIYKYGLSADGGKLFSELAKVLKSQGLEMAGDYIDPDHEITDIYQDNDYEFFNE